MRKLICSLIVVSLTFTSAFAASTPPISITVKSYQALETGAKKLINAVHPGQGDQAVAELRGGLGLSELKGVDQTRPWQAALWLETVGKEPNVSIRVPITSFSDFKAGTDEAGLFNSDANNNTLTEVDGYAVLWIEEGEPSPAAKSAHSSWKPGDLGSVDHLIRIAVTPSEQLRNELLGFVGMGRMMIGGALGEQGEAALPGMNMKALAALMGVYLDVIQMGIGGLEELAVGFNVTDDALVIDENVSAKAGSELASWLQGGGESLADILPYADDRSQAGMAMRFSNADAIKPTLKKFMRLSFELQGASPDESIVTDTGKLIDAMFPVHFAGSADFADGMNFGGVYQFPGHDVNATYAMFKDFITKGMQSQVGGDKPYKEISFKEGARTVAGVSVDQVTMVMNLDAPIYQQPGQKEMVEMMWNGGKLVFDYAIKGENMFVGTEGKIDALLKGVGNSSAKPALPVGANTVAYGHVNLLELIPKFLSANPMIPADLKEKFSTLDSTGADIAFKVDLDGAFRSQTKVPLKFITTVGQFAAGQGDGGE